MLGGVIHGEANCCRGHNLEVVDTQPCEEGTQACVLHHGLQAALHRDTAGLSPIQASQPVHLQPPKARVHVRATAPLLESNASS